MEIDLTLLGNAVFAGPALALGVYALARYRRSTTRWGTLVVVGAGLAMLATGLRIGLWVPAIFTAPEGARYAPWVWGVRDSVSFVGAAVFLAGVTLAAAGLSRSMSIPRAAIAILGIAALTAATSIALDNFY